MATPEIPFYIKPKPEPSDFFGLKYARGNVTDSKRFYFNTADKFETVRIELSFPVSGGARLCSAEKGFFDTDGLFEITYEETEAGLKISAGKEQAVFTANGEEWQIELFKNGTPKYRFSSRELNIGYNGGKRNAVEIRIPRHENELFYGLGERFNGLFQNDDVLLWNSDGYYSGSKDIPKTLSYINTPLLHSTYGYSLFFNSTYCIKAELSGDKDTCGMISDGPICDFFVWTGSPEENIASYTELTGKPFIPPDWAFDYWAGGGAIDWEINGLSIIPDIVRGWITEYEEMGAVPSALFGEGRPSENKQVYEYLSEHNVRMLMWNYSGEELQKIERLLPESAGDLPVIKYLDNPNEYYENYIDYTHPAAESYIAKKYSDYWDWGLKGIMVDFGEYVDCNTLMHNGMTGSETHNLHAYFYNKANYNVWKKRMGDDFVLFARAGCAGSQAYATNFTGDQSASFEGLREQVNAVISASASGFSVIGGDIGGFFTQPSFEVYCRWLQFAAFTPLMRAHGCPTGRNPWEWGENGRNIFKAHFFLRKNLSGHIYRAAQKSGKTGVPMVKPFVMAFPENKAVHNTERQYIFCDDIMVAPITESGVSEWNTVFPAGSWYNVWTGEKINGDNTARKVSVPYDRGPVYFAAGFADEIAVGDSLELVKPVGSGNTHRALLITEPDESVSKNGYVLKPSANGFEIILKDGAPDITVIHGKRAARILADDTELCKTDAKTEQGFFVTENGATVILHGRRKKLTVF